MNNQTLAHSYIKKAYDRLDVLDLLESKGAYSDVIREAQETVELALKGMLRLAGIEPPKIHDVGGLLLEHQDKFPTLVKERLAELAEISRWLRKEREIAFYGDIDFIPTEEYTAEDAADAKDGARLVVAMARKLAGMESP
jgi:HEPN domain-containing protein